MSIERLRMGWAVIATVAVAAAGAAAADTVKGSLVVAGKAVAVAHGTAQLEKGFFDETKDDVVVVLCDTQVPVGSTKEMFARMEMVDAGKAHCVENTINANNQVINFTVRHNGFKMKPSGGSTSMVFEPKVKTATRIEGRIRTTEPQKSFEDIPYSYDITFSLPVAPRQK